MFKLITLSRQSLKSLSRGYWYMWLLMKCSFFASFEAQNLSHMSGQQYYKQHICEWCSLPAIGNLFSSKSARYHIVNILGFSYILRLVKNRNLSLILWEQQFILRKYRRLQCCPAVHLRTMDAELTGLDVYKCMCNFNSVIILTSIVFLKNLVGSLKF